MNESYDRHTEVVAAVRKAIGPDITLMIDVQYLWNDAETCLSVVKDWKEFDIYFLETPIWSDNVEDMAKVAAEAPMKIACGEWLATRHEFRELMDVGKVQVAQPDVGRVGGIGEAKIVSDMAAERGLIIVPHCWKTGISISATAHLAFVTDHCAFIEYLPPQLCHERLRRELATEELDARERHHSAPEEAGPRRRGQLGRRRAATRPPDRCGSRSSAVTKRYGAATVLEPTSLQVADGEFLTILGPSGSGKTTDPAARSRLHPADDGRPAFGGQDITAMPTNRGPFNTVFQDYALFPHMTVEQNVGYGLMVRGRAKHEIRRKVGRDARCGRPWRPAVALSRRSSPAGRSSAWRSPGRSSASPSSSCSTSRLRRSMPSCAARCSCS